MRALTRWYGTEHTNVRLEWKLADLWIGAFWNIDRFDFYPGEPQVATLHVWVCILPCLPIHITRVLP